MTTASPSLEDRKLDWIEKAARRLRNDPVVGKFTMAQRRVLALLRWETKHGYPTAGRVIGEDAAGRPVAERIEPGSGVLRRWAVKRDGDPGDIKEPVTVYREGRANGRVFSMDKLAAADTLAALSRDGSELADSLYVRIMKSWGGRIDRSFLTLKHLSEQDIDLLVRLGAPVCGGVESPRFKAVYRNSELRVQVVVRTAEQPAKVRRFRVAGEGRPKFTLVRCTALAAPDAPSGAEATNTQEGESTMATRTRKRTTKPAGKKRKPAEDEVDEELAELEEELEELDDIEEEEPDDEDDSDDDDDDEEEEEEPKPKRKRSRAKKAAPAKKRRRRSTEEDEDEDDEDAEDEEEDEPAPRKRSRSAKAKKKSSSNGVAGRSTADITGGVGTAELAKAAKVDARTVRQYLRRHDVPKDEEVGRYHWPSTKNKQFLSLVKKIKASTEE